MLTSENKVIECRNLNMTFLLHKLAIIVFKYRKIWEDKLVNTVHLRPGQDIYRVRNLKFARNQKFATSKTLVNFMKKMMFLSQNRYFSVQKALIYYTFNKSHHNSFILLVFSHVANFRYVANFTFLTLQKIIVIWWNI